MFLVNYLNRSDTDVYWPLLECIYAAELFIICMYLVSLYPLIFAVYSTKSYHINIRLRLIGLLLQIAVCSLARIVIVYHQEFGPVEHVEPTYLIIASIVREAFKGYAVGFVLMLAIDRWIATLAWSWYESQRPSTIAAYIPLECALLLLSWTMSLLLITKIINDQLFVLYLGVVLFSGIVCYYSVLRFNRNEVEIFKKGAQIHMYSVSKCYQYRENIAILNVLNLIAGPVALSALPCFAFYSIYSNVPSDYGLNFLRYTAIAAYDLWIAIGSLVFITSLLKSEPKFRQNASEFTVIKQIMMMSGRIANEDSMFKVAPQDPNIYFAMLSRDLG